MDASEDRLIKLLGHADQRVRLRTQFELVKRQKTLRLLRVLKKSDSPQLARVHAIWGLVQSQFQLSPSTNLPWSDSDLEIRAQLAKAAGDSRWTTALDELIGMLADESARVRFHAAIAIGKIGNSTCVAPLFDPLRSQ